MGARGMSLQGGMLEFYIGEERHTHYIDLIYQQTSNQHLEEAMSGLSAQLDFIRREYPHIEEVWICSDKCSNFNSFEQIPFIVEGNQRCWVESAQSASDQNEKCQSTYSKRLAPLRVTEWMFTEAQCGKDRLDCHFSWIRREFERWLSKPKKKLTMPVHMYEALTAKGFGIKNTHVLIGNTSHPALKKKFNLPTVKVQQVYHYKYEVGKDNIKISVQHHGGVDAPKSKWSTTTDSREYQTWLSQSEFKRTPWTQTEQEYRRTVTTSAARHGAKKRRVFKSQLAAVSQYRQMVVDTAYAWSETEYATYTERNLKTFRLPEYEGTKKIAMPTKGLYVKKNPPPVQMPLPIKKVLLECFNARPYKSPEESLTEIKAMPNYKDDLFVEYFVTPKRIKGYFGRLQKYKNDNPAALGPGGIVPDVAAGPDNSGKTYRKSDGTVLKERTVLQEEVRRRNLQVRGLSSMKVADLIETLLQNDFEVKQGNDVESMEEDFELADANVSTHNGGLDTTLENVETWQAENDEEVGHVIVDDTGDTEEELIHLLLQE